MPKASPLQESFLAGELSPFVQGRVSSDQYKQGLDRCLNYIPLLQGAVTRRPGTYFVSIVKDSSKDTIVRRFEFSVTQAYILELGDQYVRFLKDHGQVVEAAKTITGVTRANPAVVTSVGHGFSNGDEVVIESVVGMTQLNGRNFRVANVAADTFELKSVEDGVNLNSSLYTAYVSGGTAQRVYTVSTPYVEANLRSLAFAQSADVLYIAHSAYAPRKLSRISDTSWTLSTITFLDGPYLPIDTSGKTLTPSASTSTTFNLTASAALFASTDVGRLIRLSPDGGTTWFWMRITVFTDSTHVTVVRTSTGALGTSALTTWRLGIWSDTTGYPSTIAFHEDRLCFSGAPANSQRIDMSVSGDYENFAPTDGVGLVTDDKAVSRTLAADDVNYVYWMKSAERGLLLGASGGEWVISPQVNSEPISPSNVQARRISSYGSAQMAPVQAGKSALFVQATRRTIREMSFFFEEDGFLAPNRTLLADHITGATGLLEIAYQKEKPSIIWGVRNDGVVMGMTYERESDALIVSCHRHIFGGVSDAGGSDAVAKSVACIPSSDGYRVEAYFVVQRRINGKSVKTIEYLTALFEHEDKQRDAFFVDCGLTYDNPIDISGATRANPVVITAASHGFSNGDKVLISDVLGMTELNGNTYTVRNKALNTFELEDVSGVAVNGTAFTAYALNGSVRKYVTTISGLWHLEGQEVDVFGDGGVQPSKTVANGAITLQDRATTVHVGLPYISQGKRLRDEAGAADGAALGKERRVHRVGFSFYRTLGISIGTDFDNLQPILFRTNDDPDGRAPALFTGIKSETIDCDYSFDAQICWEQRQPFPGTILAVGPQLETQDRG